MACGDDDDDDSDDLAWNATGAPNIFWNQFNGGDINSAEYQLWERLSWNQASWGNYSPPASESKSWSTLTDDKAAAAEALGYT